MSFRDSARAPSSRSGGVRYLGKKGELTQVLRGLGSLAPADRPAVGQIANEVKTSLEGEFAARKDALEAARRAAAAESERVDVTLPGRPPALGQQHIVTRVLDEIVDIFGGMGFQVATGPEVEWSRYNFDGLNIPAEHPARDTLGHHLHRRPRARRRDAAAHAHFAESGPRDGADQAADPRRRAGRVLPLRGHGRDARVDVLPGRGAGGRRGHLSMADMKGTLTRSSATCSARAQGALPLRLLPLRRAGRRGAIDCRVCHGKGCRSASTTAGSRYGRGMVHPRRSRGRRLRPTVYTGFAFGMGPRAHRDAQVRHRRHSPVLRQRPALPAPVPIDANRENGK